MIEAIRGGVRLHLFIQPKASRNEIVGPHNGEIKIKLSAPPVDGKANEELIDFLSEIFSVPKRQITILKGETNRHKTVEIVNVSPEQAQKLLLVE
ncbi:hypothetical protein AZI86_08815 [Bdellovibrio bacteriovorus]|uniref:UPF0235 protein AZI86_08815 n=1 Tax=Bdellovibrio bacteriovorus TaxID=959 RepID=A0A150WRG1_BDEBC|nr:DUF167 family protein [Bdellovibrio bacteriovorus]KYG67103.1 hypothetical protein AZI86_08815 [Bdellovibrio bacteriovorus]